MLSRYSIKSNRTLLENSIRPNQVFDIAYYHAMKLSEVEENGVFNRSEKGKNICMDKIDKELKDKERNKRQENRQRCLLKQL